jgi:hypothetical protein
MYHFSERFGREIKEGEVYIRCACDSDQIVEERKKGECRSKLEVHKGTVNEYLLEYLNPPPPNDSVLHTRLSPNSCGELLMLQQESRTTLYLELSLVS